MSHLLAWEAIVFNRSDTAKAAYNEPLVTAMSDFEIATNGEQHLAHARSALEDDLSRKGDHDLTPPPGIKLKPGVLQFFKHHFDVTDDPSLEAAKAYVRNFSHDAVFIGQQSELRGRRGSSRALRTLLLVRID